MKAKFVCLLAVASVGVVGASTPHVYQLGDATATARFQVQVDGAGGAEIYDDGLACKGISRIPAGSWITIKAGEPATFVAFGASNNSLFNYKFCRANVTFDPVAGASYVAQFVIDNTTCKVQVSRQLDDGSLAQVDSYLREYKGPFFQSGSWCGKRIEGVE